MLHWSTAGHELEKSSGCGQHQCVCVVISMIMWMIAMGQDMSLRGSQHNDQQNISIVNMEKVFHYQLF